MHRVRLAAALTCALALLAAGAPAYCSADAGGPADAGPTDPGRSDASLADADADAGDGGARGPCPDPAVVVAAVDGDAKLRAANDCLPEELAKLAAAVKMFDQCAGTVRPAKTWIFPVANVPPGEAIGGDGQGFIRNPRISCYVTPWAGHPAHDLFVDDRYHKNQDKDGKPFPALAVEDAFVLVAHDGWTPEDKSKGGNYLMLYLPGRHQVTYYAHLDQIFVKAGEKVAAGQVLATIGRTGKNAMPRRSQTHLHFGLWDAETFRPVNSYPLLKAARTLAATAP